MLQAAKDVFAKDLWNSHGWVDDHHRRCIVGTIRHLGGVTNNLGQTRPGGSEFKEAYDEDTGTYGEEWTRPIYLPIFTAYEEVIFACASIISPEWDVMEQYKQEMASGEEFWVDVVTQKLLPQAEDILIRYNDAQCKTTEEMIALMEEAMEVIKGRERAKVTEHAETKVQRDIDLALTAGMVTDASQIVVASPEDEDAAKAEYEERRKQDPTLPDIYPFSFLGSKKTRRKRQRRVRTKSRTGEKFVDDIHRRESLLK